MYRRATEDDIPQILSLWESYYKNEFPLPNLEEMLLVDVIEENGEIIGVNLIKPIFESIIFLDKSKSVRVKSRTLQEIFISGLAKLSSLGLDPNKIHSFIEDDDFAKLLKKHFGFNNAKGEVLVLRLD